MKSIPVKYIIKPSKKMRLLSVATLLTAFSLSSFAQAQQSPYSGSAIIIPGTVEAEHYDFGGENVAYHDTSAGNSGGSLRSDNVDVENASTGGHNVGWTAPGEWLEYSIYVNTAGTYTINANIASNAGGGSVGFEFTGATTVNSDAISFPGTNNWQAWQNTDSVSVTLNSGAHIVRMSIQSGAYNVNNFTMALTSPPVSGQTPFMGAPFSLPGTIQAEDYDNGGQNVAYYDTSSGNIPNAYRSDDVDVGPASHGGYALGYNDVGEWVEYTVDVAASGTYDLDALMASNASGGSVSFSLSGATNINSAAISIGHSGGWDTWVPSSKTAVVLNQGQHVVRLNFVSGTVNISEFSLVAQDTGGGGGGGGGGGLEAYAGYTGSYSGFTLKYDDRFDDLNSAVWAKGDGAVGNESDCRFTPQGVQVVNGKMELVVRQEYVAASWSNDHQAGKRAYNFSCGELRTIPAKRIKYGRIETRMKAPERNSATGYISSLFTYVNEGVPREWEEIDVELEGSRPDKFQANLIYGYDAADWSATRNWGAWEHKIDTAPVDQWRVFAIEWTPNAIKWFVDGNLVKTLDQSWTDCNPSCVAPQIYSTPTPDNLTELMMNFWIPNDGIQNDFGGNKSGNVYPMTTQYDWIRIYQLDSQPLTNW
ncbi:MAG: beta-glucanase (GH16 family) [Flavobacteriales bacterium]|jgi:beta-glucanase (GH16 family)